MSSPSVPNSWTKEGDFSAPPWESPPGDSPMVSFILTPGGRTKHEKAAC